MKKQKSNNYKTATIILGCLLVITLGALIYCGINMKSASDKEYLNLQDHLLNRFVELNYEKENQVCQMESHDLSKDQEVAVKFWCQDYDKDTHEKIGNKQYHTLYFQHPQKIEGGETGYAEALGE